MKGLLDILNDERRIVDQINAWTERIDILAKEIKRTQSIQPDCETKTNDIQRLTTEREIITANRKELMQYLDEVRYELSLYFKRLLDK